jgi:creatinine amidohydrolase
MPEEAKPAVDIDHMRTLPPFEARELLGDGNFGGLYRRDDADMTEIWDVAVQETRRLLENW